MNEAYETGSLTIGCVDDEGDVKIHIHDATKTYLDQAKLKEVIEFLTKQIIP